MTRRPQATTFPPTVQVVYGDADDPAGLDAALAGVDAVFVMSAQPVGSAPRPTHALIDLADVAAVAAAAFLSDQHRSAAYQLSGPQVPTPEDELRIPPITFAQRAEAHTTAFTPHNG
jgi:uncharacterized protein YbjT (DUF2867 family)